MIQTENTTDIASALRGRFGRPPRVFIRTFGCQQNVSDSERIMGELLALGCERRDGAEGADIIVFNTCAVREHAEDRVFGNVGALKALKTARPESIVCVGGCMAEQPHIAARLLASYPYVDVIFNSNELARLPSLLLEHINSSRAVDAHECSEWSLSEGMPVAREGGFRAFVPIMYGCDNFCTYCVVPLVRGRERSRSPEDVKREFTAALEAGYRDIMLLGQNVNSYGKGLACEENFPSLLRSLASLGGEYTLRFMTSHPKDATHELFDVMARCPNIAPHIHLPVQSGSDGILRRMNRRYTARQYLGLLEYARSAAPGMTFSSDVIVGFPGETREDFDATLELVRRARFASLFTFIYSRREGTPAASMPDDTPHEVKAARVAELIALQDGIALERENALIGTAQRALAVAALPDGGFEGRLWDNSSITLSGRCEVNSFCDAEITARTKKRLYGKVK